MDIVKHHVRNGVVGTAAIATVAAVIGLLEHESYMLCVVETENGYASDMNRKRWGKKRISNQQLLTNIQPQRIYDGNI